MVATLKTKSQGFAGGGWVFHDKDVQAYLAKELQSPMDPVVASKTDEETKLPAPLIALFIAHVAKKTQETRDGHILGGKK